jgi:hypothetical protein
MPRDVPPFEQLPDTGCPGFRWVGTTMMDEDQYRGEGWHVATRFTRPDGKVIETWSADFTGLQARSIARAGRLSGWRRRQEEDASWRDAVDDAKPAGYVR